MQICGGIIVLLLILSVVFMTFMSYPTAIMFFALKVYRHAREIERMHKRQTMRVNEEWMRELEK